MELKKKDVKKFLESYRRLCNKYKMSLDAELGDGCGYWDPKEKQCCEPGKSVTLTLYKEKQKIVGIEWYGPKRQVTTIYRMIDDPEFKKEMRKKARGKEQK